MQYNSNDHCIYRKQKKLFLTGESYAGVYIPYITRAILDRNANTSTPSTQHLNLISIAIGNPILDVVNRTLSCLPYGIANNIMGEPYIGFFKNNYQPACLKEIAEIGDAINEDQSGSYYCSSAYSLVATYLYDQGQPCVNRFDIRHSWDTSSTTGCKDSPNYPPGIQSLKPWLNVK